MRKLIVTVLLVCVSDVGAATDLETAAYNCYNNAYWGYQDTYQGVVRGTAGVDTLEFATIALEFAENGYFSLLNDGTDYADLYVAGFYSWFTATLAEKDWVQHHDQYSIGAASRAYNAFSWGFYYASQTGSIPSDEQ